MRKLSKGFFAGSVGVGLGFADITLIIGFIRRITGPDYPEGNLPEERILVWCLLLFVGVVMAVLFYRMWASIQDGHARTSPARAIGFLFIPLFNIYWAFQAIWGFAKDFNAFINRHSVAVPKLPEGLFLTFTILCFTGWIPVIGLWLVIANYFVGLLMISKICDAVNSLPQRSA